MKKYIPTLFVVIMIIYMIITNGSKTQAVLDANAEYIEDYTSETKQLHFGDRLKDEIYTNQTFNDPFIIFDIDRLAYAVSCAETSCGTKGSAVSHKNAFGIMTWEHGYRELKHYKSIKDSHEDFKRIWSKGYGNFPTMKEAYVWTGNDSPKQWYNNVVFYYLKGV